MRQTGKFLKTLRWWPVTLGAIGAFALYPTLTEDFKKNPMKVYAEICNFIGADSSFSPNMSAKHNTGSLTNSRLLTLLFMKKNIRHFVSPSDFPSTIKLISLIHPN